MPRATAAKVTLRVKDQGGGPVVYARFRRDDVQTEPALGRGWLVPAGSALAKPRGKAIGRWVDRRGRAPDGALTVDAAWQAVPAAIAEYERKLARRAAKAKRAADAGTTLRDGVEWWLDARKADDPDGEREAWKHSHAKNMTNYARRIVRELGPDRLIDTFEGAELRRWLAEDLKPIRNGEVLDRPTSRKLRATYAQALSGIFGYALSEGWIEVDPTAELPAYRIRRKRSDDPLRREEYLTSQELRAALVELRAGDRKRRTGRARSVLEREQDAVMIMVMGMVGLRPGEAIALLWEHIDFGAKVIRVVDSRTMGVTDTPKSGSGRYVPMSNEVARALRGLAKRSYLTAPTNLVFVGRDGAHVDTGTLGDRFDDAQARAGITPHRDLRQMRNTFGTVCAAKGVPLRTIQQWLGHASITTTEIYASFMPREQDAALIEEAFA
jgi:integrase